MAMSRSLGSTSFISLPPMYSSPPEMSSRPAIIRSVVDLPQPEGPTSTMNSLSAISTLPHRQSQRDLVPPLFFRQGAKKWSGRRRLE